MHRVSSFSLRHCVCDSESVLAAADICKAALGYLSTGLNTKSITSAASE